MTRKYSVPGICVFHPELLKQTLVQNRRSVISIVVMLLVATTLIGSIVFVAKVHADSGCPQCIGPGYTTLNPFYDPNNPDHFECTRYAWGRAYEKLNVSLTFTQKGGLNADVWFDEIASNFAKGSTPQADSIIVFRGGPAGDGHVAYLESINGNDAYITEANLGASDGQFSDRHYPLSSLTVGSGAYLGRTYSIAGFIYLTNGTTPSSDPLVASLSSTTQNVAWFYIYNPASGWYIVSSTGQVLYLVQGDATVSGTIIWKPINNYPAYLNYPAAGQNFSSVAVSADGRSVSFGTANALTTDPLVFGLSRTTQAVVWFYVYNPPNGWYIVNSSSQVLYLVQGDAAVTGTIIWKPINNYAAYLNYPAAGQNFTSVVVSTNGGQVFFGSLE